MVEVATQRCALPRARVPQAPVAGLSEPVCNAPACRKSPACFEFATQVTQCRARATAVRRCGVLAQTPHVNATCGAGAWSLPPPPLLPLASATARRVRGCPPVFCGCAHVVGTSEGRRSSPSRGYLSAALQASLHRVAAVVPLTAADTAHNTLAKRGGLAKQTNCGWCRR